MMMIDNRLPSIQDIIDCLKINYGIEVIALICLPWGADSNASVYQAQTQDKLYFVKLKHGHHHELSVAIAKLLHDTGLPQIIPPINTIGGQPVQFIDHFTLIVYPFIEGSNGFDCALTDEQWVTLGKAMRHVHDLNVPLSIQNQVRRESYSSTMRMAVRALFKPIADEYPSDDIAFKLWTFMKEHQGIILQLVNIAEQLSQKVNLQSTRTVLCHSDIHAGNVLIDKNNTLYIVDWDEPILAPKERDLMFIGAGVGNVWNKPEEVALFYQGYGNTNINMPVLAYYRHERIVEDIAFYGQNLLLSASGGENRKTMFQHFIDMFETNGVVDIAFKSFSTVKKS